jgi:antitoxin ChpS
LLNVIYLFNFNWEPIMPTARLRTLGGSAIVAIPPALLSQIGLAAGGKIEISLEGDALILRKPARVKPRYTLAELLAQCEPGPFEVDREWMDAPAVGNEFGSPDWNRAEQEGRLEEFLNSTDPTDASSTA